MKHATRHRRSLPRRLSLAVGFMAVAAWPHLSTAQSSATAAGKAEVAREAYDRDMKPTENWFGCPPRVADAAATDEPRSVVAAGQHETRGTGDQAANPNCRPDEVNERTPESSG